LAGLVQGLAGRAVALGFSALKGDFHQNVVREMIAPENWPNWGTVIDYHFGGYAKTPVELLDFMAEMEAHYDLPLEPIYTAKLLYGVLDMAKKGRFPTGSRICVVHTGGLQGWKGKK
jgi:1-aminocyclopropane-1-carboxylate deaminase